MEGIMGNLIKIEGIEFTPAELEQNYNNGKIYILKFRSIYELIKDGGKFRTRKIYAERGALPITKPGRYFMWSRKQVESYYKI